MRSFKDAKGDVWNLSFTVGDAFRLKRELGIDVDKLIVNGNSEIELILSDMWRLIEILVLLLGPQIEAKKLLEDIKGTDKAKPKDEFFDRFSGDVLDEATTALFWAIGESLPKLKRRAFLAMMEKLTPTVEKLMVSMEAKIQEMNLDEKIATAFK